MVAGLMGGVPTAGIGLTMPEAIAMAMKSSLPKVETVQIGPRALMGMTQDELTPEKVVKEKRSSN